MSHSVVTMCWMVPVETVTRCMVDLSYPVNMCWMVHVHSEHVTRCPVVPC